MMSDVRSFIIWKCFALYSHWCRMRLCAKLPGIREEMQRYSLKSKTTGTKWPTLWRAVRIILSEKPIHILECGTGLSTVVLAEAVYKLRSADPSYNGKIKSMESLAVWHEKAIEMLPEKYKEFTSILLGPREKYERLFFRGYKHSEIPEENYDFVFLDGPDYTDECGSSFCADILHVVETSKAPLIRGVVDTRVSSVFVLQQLFGAHAVRYYAVARTCDLKVAPTKLNGKLTSRQFSNNIFGRLTLHINKSL